MNIEDRLRSMREKNLNQSNGNKSVIKKTPTKIISKINPKKIDIKKNINPTKRTKNKNEEIEALRYKKKGFARGITKVDDEQLKISLMHFRGIIGRVCKRHNITRQSIWDRINKSPDLTQALKDSRESLKDDIEDGFLEAVQRRERWAIEKGIDRLLQSRGYVDKKELETIEKRDEKDVERKKNALRNLSVDELKSIRDTQLKAFEMAISNN